MRTLVLGAGISGKAAAHLALRLGHRVVVYDRDPVDGLAGIALSTGRWDPLLLDGVDLVVTSPGLPERSAPITDALEAGIEVIAEVELAWRHMDAPTVGVTGTNGKTTVTGLVSDMLEASGLRAPALGNIGSPASDAVGEPLDVVVLELSSFQLRFTEALRCAAAVVTNVAEDHLDWHGTTAGYRAAKAKIVANQTDDDLVVFDALDPGAAAVAFRSAGTKVGVAVDGSRPVGVVRERLDWGGPSVALGSLGVDDPAYLADLAMAGVAALAMGAEP